MPERRAERYTSNDDHVPDPRDDATRWDDATPPPTTRAGAAPGDTTDVDAPGPGAAPRPPSTRWDGRGLAEAATVHPAHTFLEVTHVGPVSAAPAPAPAPAPAAATSGYELLGELGRGGMGVVYRARERATGREVALKVVLADVGTALARFRREGEVTAALRHPNILRVHGAGELGGRPFIAFELVEGCRTLADVLPQRSLAERAAYVRDAARALGHAHARGVVHRDVKPQNLLVDPAGLLKVADFGLAAGAELERLTLSGAHLGTPSYMAPEQVDARRDALGPWTDVWALGVILYEALVGQRPFPSGSFTTLVLHVLDREPPAPRTLVPAVPADLEAICLKALAKRPADRYPDGEALARDLDRALGGEAVDAAAARRRRGHLRRALLAAAGVTLIAGLLGAAHQARAHLATRALVDEARATLATARRARGTSIDDLLAAAAAHRVAEEALAHLPAADAQALLAAEDGLTERRREALTRLVPALLAAARSGEAIGHARDLDRVAPSWRARAWLIDALTLVPEHRAEAHRLAQEAARTADPDALRAAADALVALHRPLDAARALAPATRPDLVLLRARARLAAGDAAGALADSGAADGADEVERAVVRARAATALGRSQEALTALEATRREAGARREWHLARAEALGRSDRPGEAQASFATALSLAETPAARAEVRAARGRLALRRGRFSDARADLDAAGARLDAAIAAWSAGERDEVFAGALDDLARAVDAFEAPPQDGEAARRWRALTPPEPQAVARGLLRQARLLLPGAAKDDDLRARAGRLLARAAALAPDDAGAQADLAWATRDLSLADRTVERWPDVVRARRARLRARLDAGWQRPAVQEDAAWLAERRLADGLDLLFAASVRADGGDLDGAWTLLEPWLDEPGPDPRVLDLAAKVAHGRGDTEAAARLRDRLESVKATIERKNLIQREVFDGGDLLTFDARLRDLPRDGTYYRWRLEQACQLNDATQAALSLAHLLLVGNSTGCSSFLQVAHSYGYQPLQDAARVAATLDAAVAAAPESPVGHLARAAHLSSAYHRATSDDDRRELAHQAADHALAGAALEPDRPGPLLLAAFCLVDARDLALAEEVLDSAHAALGKDTDLVAFVRARLAGARGDAALASAALARMDDDPQTYHSLYRLDADPAFAPVVRDPAFALPAWKKRR
jgi:serine/threonine-protein kinase